MKGPQEDKKFSQIFDQNYLILFCSSCIQAAEIRDEMAAIPQAAFAARKIRSNENKLKLLKHNVDLNPTNYSSKFMNSIWGQYNRYSVHNLKKIMDDNIFWVFGTQNEKSMVTSLTANKPLFSADLGTIKSPISLSASVFPQ